MALLSFLPWLLGTARASMISFRGNDMVDPPLPVPLAISPVVEPFFGWTIFR